MSEPLTEEQDGITSRSAIWIRCGECGHVSRALAVMASRVLEERRQCPTCFSTDPPFLSLAQAGAHIPQSEGRAIAVNDRETEFLRSWIGREAKRLWLLRIAGAAGRELAARFSRRRPPGRRPEPPAGPLEPGIDLSTPEKHLL